MTGAGFEYGLRVVRECVRREVMAAYPDDGIEVRYQGGNEEATPGEQAIHSIEAPGHDDDALEDLVRGAYARALDMGMWDDSDFERAG